MIKKRYKEEIYNIIKKWKNDKSNKEYLKQITNEFVDDFFKTLLINYPKDSTWIHNLENEKFSEIAHARFQSFDTGDVKYNEIISMNVIEPDENEEDWSDIPENEQFDILNIIVDCSKILDPDELKSIVSKYKTMAFLIGRKFKTDICIKYGDEFKENVFNHVLKDHLSTDKNLNILISFINIIDENINLKSFPDDVIENYSPENYVFCQFYNSEKFYRLFEQCKQCQWPYVNAAEELNLTSKDICQYKTIDRPLNGYMCNVSAKSIAKLYENYGYGLFSGNIRYYIKRGKGVVKVDEGLDSSISKPDLHSLFYFKNNGITFITPSVKFDGKKVKLRMFSIVNGGQTTYKIGNVPFDEDFTVPCKIVEIKIDISDRLKKHKPELYNKNLNEWLKYAGEISDALNSQKPVSDKDLITNKPVVRNLKSYYNNSGTSDAFLLTKAGEEKYVTSVSKDKQIKLEAYLIMVYCFYLQLPGFAKNKKSKMYKPAQIGRVLGPDDAVECKKFFSPSQLAEINIAKSNVDKLINQIALENKKNDEIYPTDDDKLTVKLLKNSKNIVLSLLGLVRMQMITDQTFDNYQEYGYFEAHFSRKYNIYVDLRKPLFINENLNNKKIWKEMIWEVGKQILLPSFKKWKDVQEGEHLSSEPRLMTMKDEYYCNFVAQSFIKMYKTNKKQWDRIFIDIMPLSRDGEE